MCLTLSEMPGTFPQRLATEFPAGKEKIISETTGPAVSRISFRPCKMEFGGGGFATAPTGIME